MSATHLAASPRSRAHTASGISIRDVSHTYGARSATGMLALDGIDLEIGDGEFHCLLGPSGCGKSTLLYLIGGFIPVQAGTISTSAGLVTAPGPDRSIVFQNFALFPWKTVKDNVLYGLKKAGIASGEREQRAQRYIDMVHLTGFENAYPSQLSGGMQQRAAIARTLAVDPGILLMDEPFGALDAQTRRVMQEELRAIWRDSRKTVVFVTHDVQEAVFLADRISIMSARPGRIEHVIDVDLPKDRGEEILENRDFIGLSEQIWRLVREQAVAATRGAH